MPMHTKIQADPFEVGLKLLSADQVYLIKLFSEKKYEQAKAWLKSEDISIFNVAFSFPLFQYFTREQFEIFDDWLWELSFFQDFNEIFMSKQIEDIHSPGAYERFYSAKTRTGKNVFSFMRQNPHGLNQAMARISHLLDPEEKQKRIDDHRQNLFRSRLIHAFNVPDDDFEKGKRNTFYFIKTNNINLLDPDFCFPLFKSFNAQGLKHFVDWIGERQFKNLHLMKAKGYPPKELKEYMDENRSGATRLLYREIVERMSREDLN